MSRAKWEKTPYTVTWTIHTVDLKASVDGEFKLEWSRGSSKGSSDLVLPNDSNCVVFEAQFEIPCTMFVSKTDGMARQKNLKIVLKRHKKNHSKVYGKLTVDIGKFYGKPGIIKEEVEMESGRAIAPIISMSFALHKEGEMMEVGAVDGTDLSFMGEPQDRMPTAIDEWDVTEVHEAPHGKGKKKKKGKHKHSRHDSKRPPEPETKEKTTQEPPQEKEEVAEAKPETKEEVDEAKPETKEEVDEAKPEDKEEVTESQPPESKEEVDEAKPEHGEEEEQKPPAEDTKEEEDVKNHHPKEEIQESSSEEEPPKEAEPEAMQVQSMSWDQNDLDEDQLNKELVEQLFNDLANHSWTYETGFIDASKKYKYPAVVFPVFAAMIQAQLFSETIYTKEDFEYIADKICEDLASSNLCGNYTTFQKFLTYLMLYLLVLKSEQFDNDRSESMCEHLLDLVRTTTRDLTRQSILSFEVLVNRFATAKFEMEPLLEDFKHIYRDVRNSLRYLPSINRFLLNYILSVVEIRIINRMLANPARFMFKNAVLWNSFISAFLSDERLEMTRLREMVSAMIMAHSMAADPDMQADIAGNTDPNVILFIMSHYNPDEMMPEKIDCTKFAATHGLPTELAMIDEIPEPEITDLGKLGEEAILPNWNKYSVSESLLARFPFLDNFASLD